MRRELSGKYTPPGLLPAGEYEFEVEGVRDAENGEGEQRSQFSLMVRSGLHLGRNLVINMPKDGFGPVWIRWLLDAIGKDPTVARVVDDTEFLGHTFHARVTHRKRGNRFYESVTPLPVWSLQPKEKEELRTLDELLEALNGE